MTASPTNVVFDLGGVLIDWNPRYHFRDVFKGDEPAMERFLSTVCTPAWNERQDAGRKVADAEIELISRFPREAANIRQYYAGFDRMMRGAIEGTVEILDELVAARVPLYALTNWSADTFPLALKRFPFFRRFKGIVVSGEIKAMKPDRRIFDHLLHTHSLAAAECVFIDDSEKNVVGARAVGLHGLHFRSPEQLRRDLAKLGLPVSRDGIPA